MNIYEVIGRMILEEEKEKLEKKQDLVKEFLRGQQKTASASEQAARAANMTTQGRKGCKARRINMAFTPENHRFLTHEARKNGETITHFCNRIITQYRCAKEADQ